MKNTSQKGRKLVQLAKKILEAKGCQVEVAVNAIRWIPRKDKQGMMPISAHHDFFGVWDLLAVWPASPGWVGRRVFFQVTTVSEVSRRRAKILDSKFPACDDDAILAYVGRPRRHFRVYSGPSFEAYKEEWPCEK